MERTGKGNVFAFKTHFPQKFLLYLHDATSRTKTSSPLLLRLLKLE